MLPFYDNYYSIPFLFFFCVFVISCSSPLTISNHNRFMRSYPISNPSSPNFALSSASHPPPFPSPQTFQRPYIAASWDAKDLPESFSLGDDSVYGGYSNKRLTRGRTYRVFLRAYAMKDHLYTSSPFSEALSTDIVYRPPSGEVSVGGITMTGQDHILYFVSPILVTVLAALIVGIILLYRR